MLRFVRAAASTALWPSEDVSPLRDVFVRTATYALSQMVDRRPKDAALHLQPLLHRALLPSPDAREKRTSNIVGDPVVTSPVELLADLRILTLFAVNSHPSPRLYPFIFDPILAPLLSLFLFVRSQPTTDPVLRDEIQSLLVLYVRTAEKAEMAIDRVLDGLRDLETGSSSFYWSRDADGGTCLRRRIAERAAEEGEEDTMMVAYDAKDVAALLKEADRKEVSGGLFLRWLDELEHYSKQGGLEAAKRCVPSLFVEHVNERLHSSILRLSLVTEALGTVGDSIISKPRELLAFIRHTLVYEPTNSSHPSPNGNSLLDDQLGADLDDLRVTTDEQQDAAASDEMRLTALTLLLAFLTGETEIEEEEAGILAVLKPAVDRIANSDASVELIAAAREARTVLALRSAAAVIPNGRNEEQSPFAESHKVYQESLRLLEDPILPVRGHGLAQLAGLVKAGRTPAADPALRPAILDIFVRALENDDSFLYLTAIHGLRDFASSGKGRDVVSRLAGIFASVERKLDWASQKGGREQDRRLRAGEALTQIVADRGQALSTTGTTIFARFLRMLTKGTVDLLVPPLLLAFRDPDLPIPLRASSFTLLASAVEASPLSLAPYTSSLLDASVTLLSLETRPFVRNVTTEPEPAYPPPNRTDAPKYEETPDAATKDAKGHPALRRSACLFIALLFRSAERDAALMLLRDHGKRAETALGYVGDVDEDGLVRVQAKTALEAMRASVQ